MARVASASPRRGLSDQISAMGARLSRVLSDADGSSKSDAGSSDKPRSVSRGRETLQSTGRGGLGNIRSPSQGGEHIVADGPDNMSPTRGRERPVDATVIHSTGRGGAGNIRSPSRDATKGADYDGRAYEQEVIRHHVEAEGDVPHSSGRGGLGNISRSRSRDVGPRASQDTHSTGRGGVGNIVDGRDSFTTDQEERRSHLHDDGIHSTGRGGLANVTAKHAGGVEHVDHLQPEIQSTGRGGSGNIRPRSVSREAGRRTSTERGALGFVDKLIHPHKDTVPEE